MISRRQTLAGLVSTLATIKARASLPSLAWPIDPQVLRLGFGSCVSQDLPQPFWRNIEARSPHGFLLLGDGVYPEEGEGVDILDSLKAAYGKQGRQAELTAFRERVPMIAIWDDNDYGGADIGGGFVHKERSRELFLDFWTTPEEAAIRRRDSGIYGLWEFGETGRRTQVIVLDLRYCRSEWAHTQESVTATLESSGFGPYRAAVDAGLTMLGEAQWAWLESVLRRPAELRLLVSSIQFTADRGWESWSNFPNEKARLLSLIAKTEARGVLLLSGDTHYGEMARIDDTPFGYPLWEITSSGLTECWPDAGPNAFRVGRPFPETNFGFVHVNWLRPDPMIVAELYATGGRRLAQQSIRLSSLSV